MYNIRSVKTTSNIFLYFIFLEQSYVACGWGISKIGYAMICFGIANTLAAIVAGGLTKWVGRLPLLLATMALHAGLLVWMGLWVAVDSDYVTYCTMAALWGLADGVWLVLVNCE